MMRSSSWMVAVSVGVLTFAGVGGCGGDTNGGGSANAGSGGSSAGSGGSGASSGSGGTAGNTSGGSSMGGSAGSGGSPDWAACTMAGECVARTRGCCEPCGQATVDDVVGVNMGQLEAFGAENCPEPGDCPACASEPNPNLYAYCGDGGSCQVADLRAEPMSECSSAADCVLRTEGCCALCGDVEPWSLISVARDGLSDYLDRVCSPLADCADCESIIPAGYHATCGQGGHCEVAYDPELCPSQLPNPDDPCDSQGLTCEYGDDPRPDCRTQALCGMGRWMIDNPSCDPIVDAGSGDCPATPAPGSLCPTEGLICDYGSDEYCVCSACGGGPCGVDARFTCVAPPTTSGCPPTPAPINSPCDQADLYCEYGNCTRLSAGRQCTGSRWVDQPVACPL